MCPKLPYLVKQTCFLKITFGGIFQSDFVISIYIGMFKTARNHPKKYHLCQKPAKSGSARNTQVCRDNDNIHILACKNIVQSDLIFLVRSG